LEWQNQYFSVAKKEETETTLMTNKEKDFWLTMRLQAEKIRETLNQSLMSSRSKNLQENASRSEGL